MLKEIRKNEMKGTLPLLIVLAIVGVALILCSGVQNLFVQPVSLIQLSPKELEGQYVEYDMWLSFDSFAEVIRTVDDNEISEYQDFLFPMEEKYYLNVRIYHEDYEKFAKLVDDSFAWLDYETDELPEPYSISGVIKPLSNDELPYFYDYIGLSEAEANQLGYYALVIDTQDKTVGDTAPATIFFMLLFGTFMIGMSVVLYGRINKMKNHALLVEFLNKYPEKEEYLENWMKNESDLYGFRVNGDYFFYQSKRQSYIVPASDVLWMYVNVTTQRVNFIPVGKTYQLKLGLRNGSLVTTNVSGEDEAREIIQAALKVHPGIVAGYSKELEQLFASNRERFAMLKQKSE